MQPPRAIGTGLHALPGRRAYVIAAAIVAAFALLPPRWRGSRASFPDPPPAVAVP